MDSCSQGGEGKKKITEVKTFPVPFSLGEIKENIIINTDNLLNLSKEEIFNKAFMFQAEGNILEAIKFYQLYFDRGFSDAIAFSNYGIILRKLGRLHEAEIFLYKAIKLKPNYAKAYSNLGNILRDLGKLKEAEISSRTAIELNPKLAEAHSNLGGILKDLGKLKEAELSIREAIELNPKLAEAHCTLGTLLIELGNLEESILCYEKAIDLDKNLDEAKAGMGRILLMTGQLKEGVVKMREAFGSINFNYKNSKIIIN
mgnify:CR=1 FL=1